MENKYDINKFLSFFPEFKPALENENSLQRNIYNMYSELAKNTFSENLYFENTEMVWSLYIAHHLQMSFNRQKNVNNNANLNSSIVTVSKKDNVGGKEEKFRSSINEFYNSYAQTEYGILLYSMVKNVETLNMIGVY